MFSPMSYENNMIKKKLTLVARKRKASMLRRRKMGRFRKTRNPLCLLCDLTPVEPIRLVQGRMRQKKSVDSTRTRWVFVDTAVYR